MTGAAGLLRKIVGDRQADEGCVDIGRGTRDAVLDRRGEADADRPRPLLLRDQVAKRGGDRRRRRRMRRDDADFFAEQLAGFRFDKRRFDARAADVNSQNMHIVSAKIDPCAYGSVLCPMQGAQPISASSAAIMRSACCR